eukprot:TRINITY_DN4825_c0_g4_i1.p1 TRINITY_DN4825_c0_g4~~TRINITY_DN4825_c0_g4_i1.p1  ORF type:complete len:169 (-),score=18.34 TRINITY_DN4825_c0_g4_i1:118-624(-)
MGCGASAPLQGPFTQVVPFDDTELDSKHLSEDCKLRDGRLMGSFILNADVEPEPANSVSFKSFCFEPSPNYAPGQPTMPGARNHKRHLVCMNRMFKLVGAAPKALESIVNGRREQFDHEAKLQDSMELEECQRLRKLLLKERQELLEQRKSTSGSGHSRASTHSSVST